MLIEQSPAQACEHILVDTLAAAYECAVMSLLDSALMFPLKQVGLHTTWMQLSGRRLPAHIALRTYTGQSILIDNMMLLCCPTTLKLSQTML